VGCHHAAENTANQRQKDAKGSFCLDTHTNSSLFFIVTNSISWKKSKNNSAVRQMRLPLFVRFSEAKTKKACPVKPDRL
jgi:hypothetical protein